MEVTKENLEYAYKHTSSQWDFYWRHSNNDPRWFYNPPIEFYEGGYGLCQFRCRFSA